MKWIPVLFLVLVIQKVSTRRHAPKQRYKNHEYYEMPPSLTHNKLPTDSEESLFEQTNEPSVELEVDTGVACPLGCVCQYAQFMDLPISRWITQMQGRSAAAVAETIEQEDLSNDIEVNSMESFEAGDGPPYLMNPHMKQATCILQGEDPAELVKRLPHDLQALILLYTGIGQNQTVNTSTFLPLNQLTTLEIRGPPDLSFRLSFDEPLSYIQHANFESILLCGSDSLKRPNNPVHPSESFDYKPKAELYAEGYNTTGDIKLGFEPAQEEPEILPYELYMQELKKARMPSFYGWRHLEVLRIHGCHLNELYWEMFDGLEALQHLSLERNSISGVPAFALYGALHIKSLSLAHNNISDLHYRALGGLLELEALDLSDNRLSKLSELSFPPFPKLERLDFRNNPIKYIFPATFWVMNRTRQMYFGSQQMPLELWGNAPFQSLRELRELSIGNVSIMSLEQNVFKDLISLEVLKLKGVIRSIEFDAFAGMTALQELDISSCNIQEISMDAFMGCKKLRSINLANNNISYIPPGLFDDQQLLEEIYLEGNQLRTLPTTFFLQPKLRLARLTDNPWKCSCDMNNWHPKITNQERGPRIESCITDFLTRKQIACRLVDNFKFERRHAPRCSNFNGRSVYYVLRKQLQCGGGRLLRARTKKRPSTRQHYQGASNAANESNQQDVSSKRLVWQAAHRQQELRKTNTLEHVLSQNTGVQRHRVAESIEDNEISNDI